MRTGLEGDLFSPVPDLPSAILGTNPKNRQVAGAAGTGGIATAGQEACPNGRSATVSDAESSPTPKGPSVSDETAGRGGEPEAVTRAIARLRQGRDTEGSFRLLYETYRSPVRGFFARRVASADLCQDLTQETFLRVHKGLEAFRGDAPFGAWLFRIAWNVLHSHRARKSHQMESIPLEETHLERAAPAQASRHEPAGAFSETLRNERRRILRDAITRLPPQRRRCMVLWAVQELSYEQIAVVMRLSIGTVKAHLAQARRQLESLVAEATHDSGGDR